MSWFLGLALKQFQHLDSRLQTRSILSENSFCHPILHRNCGHILSAPCTVNHPWPPSESQEVTILHSSNRKMESHWPLSAKLQSAELGQRLGFWILPKLPQAFRHHSPPQQQKVLSLFSSGHLFPSFSSAVRSSQRLLLGPFLPQLWKGVPLRWRLGSRTESFGTAAPSALRATPAATPGSQAHPAARAPSARRCRLRRSPRRTKRHRWFRRWRGP